MRRTSPLRHAGRGCCRCSPSRRHPGYPQPAGDLLDQGRGRACRRPGDGGRRSGARTHRTGLRRARQRCSPDGRPRQLRTVAAQRRPRVRRQPQCGWRIARPPSDGREGAARRPSRRGPPKTNGGGSDRYRLAGWPDPGSASGHHAGTDITGGVEPERRSRIDRRPSCVAHVAAWSNAVLLRIPGRWPAQHT